MGDTLRTRERVFERLQVDVSPIVLHEVPEIELRFKVVLSVDQFSELQKAIRRDCVARYCRKAL